MAGPLGQVHKSPGEFVVGGSRSNPGAADDEGAQCAGKAQILERLRAGWMVKQDGLSNHIQGAANRGRVRSRTRVRLYLQQCGVSIDNESDQAS